MNKPPKIDMIIAVGSTNRVKLQAVEEVLKDYPHFSEATVCAFSVLSEIRDQPMSLEEIITGAKNRAKNAFAACPDCSYSFGIESGLFEATGTHTGFLESTICSIFNGAHYCIGLSCGFEVPPPILGYVLKENMDLSQACYHSGITSNDKLGAAEGLIGLLTKDRINRKEYTKQCVKTALIQIEHAPWYNRHLA